jgi:DNA-binding MarR family transcriptional regulator
MTKSGRWLTGFTFNALRQAMKRDSPPKDPRGGHVRLYWALLDSPAWRVLSHADVRVYLALRRKLGKFNNGDINATLTEMRHSGIRSSSTLATALQRLEKLGFIEKTRQGGIANGGKLCSLFRFTDEQNLDIPKLNLRASRPTSDFEQFATMAQAKEAIRGLTHREKGKVRLAKRTALKTKADAVISALTVKQGALSPTRKSKPEATSKKACQPA